MIEEDILLIITKDLTGQSNECEKITLGDWLSESKENSALYHSYREAFLIGKYELKIANKDKVYDKLTERLDLGKNQFSKQYNKSSLQNQQISRRWLKIAATIIILIASTTTLYLLRDFLIPSKEIVVSNTMIIKSNPAGKKSLITLPDGSHVKLNSESHLEYSSNFYHDRSVKLIGEAFFDVVKDTLRPFYVNSGDLSIRVVGTSFNVEAFPFEKNIKVALVTGKVLVEKQIGLARKTIEQLSPSEMLIYDHHSSKVNIRNFDEHEVLGWKNGELHFDNTSYDEVIKKLERWYGVDIIVDSKALMSGRFNGTYKDESLDVVLEGMGFTTDFNYEIVGNKIYIK